MFFFDNKIAFKKPPNSGPLPGATPSQYKFNEVSGYPKSVATEAANLQNQWAGQPIDFAHHVNERANASGQGRSNIHGIQPDSIPNINRAFPKPEHGFKPVEIEHDGKNITKLLMRGPYNEMHDVVMPIVPGKNGKPLATTIWANEKEDDRSADSTRRGPDLNRIHLPHEFQRGKLPRRQLVSEEESRRPGYQPIPITRQKSRQRIIDQYGVKNPEIDSP